VLLNKPSSILGVQRNDYFSFLFSLVPSEEKFNFFSSCHHHLLPKSVNYFGFSLFDGEAADFDGLGVCLLPILLYLSHSLTLFAFSHFTFIQLMFDCLIIFY
jgi:hypothetical protein